MQMQTDHFRDGKLDAVCPLGTPCLLRRRREKTKCRDKNWSRVCQKCLGSESRNLDLSPPSAQCGMVDAVTPSLKYLEGGLWL